MGFYWFSVWKSETETRTPPPPQKEPRGTLYIVNTGIWYELLISSKNQSWSYSLNYKHCADSGIEKVHSYFSYLYKLGISILSTSLAIQLVIDFNVLWTALVYS